MIKKVFLSVLLLSFLFAADTLGSWQKAKGLYYYFVPELKKDREVIIPFTYTKKNMNFSAVAIGNGNGNFDIDMAIFDSNRKILAMDTKIDVVAVNNTVLKDANAVTIKVNCTSGRGKTIIYAGETEKVLKIFAKSAM